MFSELSISRDDVARVISFAATGVNPVPPQQAYGLGKIHEGRGNFGFAAYYYGASAASGHVVDGIEPLLDLADRSPAVVLYILQCLAVSATPGAKFNIGVKLPLARSEILTRNLAKADPAAAAALMPALMRYGVRLVASRRAPITTRVGALGRF